MLDPAYVVPWVPVAASKATIINQQHGHASLGKLLRNRVKPHVFLHRMPAGKTSGFSSVKGVGFTIGIHPFVKL